MSDVEYWTKRVAELEEQSAKAEDFFKRSEKSFYQCTARGQKPRRYRLTQFRNDSEDLKKTLATAKDEYARARQEEANLAMWGKGELIHSQFKSLQSVNTRLEKHGKAVLKLLKSLDSVANDLRELGDTPMRAALNERIGSFAMWFAAQLARDVPGSIEPLARSLADSKANDQFVGDKSISDMTPNYHNDFLKRHPDAKVKF